MAKFEVASEDVEKLFDEVRDNTTIPNWVEFKVLSSKKQKEVIKVVKSNKIVELLTEGINFVVIVNEEILGGLPDEFKRIVIDECLAGVAVSETETLSIEKPDFNTHTGVLAKYGDSKIIQLHESVKSLYDVKKQKEDELKAQTKGKRGRKPKQQS